MALKRFNPTSPGMRHAAISDRQELTADKPLKALTRGEHSTGGRNSKGRVSCRFRGGGAKRRYRQIDFKRNKDGVPARVHSIEYDPNRNVRIALVVYADGEKRYVLAPTGLQVGQQIVSGSGAPFRVGNAMMLSDIPQGMEVHNVELQPGAGGVIARSAGQSARIRAKEGRYAQVRMPSGEVRLIHLKCRATIGELGHIEHAAQNLGKAGRARRLGRRPHVRGVSMNPVDHPMGGGEGRTSGGGDPVSPWGMHTKGKKTRNKRKRSSKFILDRKSVV